MFFLTMSSFFSFLCLASSESSSSSSCSSMAELSTDLSISLSSLILEKVRTASGSNVEV